MPKIIEHTTRKDGTPIIRTTYIDDKGNEVQTVESEDYPPVISVKPAGWKYSVIKQVERNTK